MSDNKKSYRVATDGVAFIVQAQVTRGWIFKRKVWVDLGHYATLSEFVTKKYSNFEEAKAICDAQNKEASARHELRQVYPAPSGDAANSRDAGEVAILRQRIETLENALKEIVGPMPGCSDDIECLEEIRKIVDKALA